MGGRRLKPQKYVLGSGYVHSGLEPVINLLYPTEREILGLTVLWGGGSSSIAKMSILMKMIVSKIDPLKAVLYPEKGG